MLATSFKKSKTVTRQLRIWTVALGLTAFIGLTSLVLNQAMSIRPGDGVGNFYLEKTTLKKIQADLGKGEIKKQYWVAPHCGQQYPYYELVYADKGITFTFYQTKELKSSSKFWSIQLTEKFNAQTESLISAGHSTRADIYKAFGQPAPKEPNKTDFGQYISYGKIGISFEFKNCKNLPTDTIKTITVFPKE